MTTVAVAALDVLNTGHYADKPVAVTLPTAVNEVLRFGKPALSVRFHLVS